MAEHAGAGTADAQKERRARQDVQAGLLFVVIFATSVAVLLVSLFFPATGEGGWLTFATVQPHREFIWWFLTLAGVNIVVTAVPVSLASVMLAPARGWRWVTAGAAIAIVGAAFYAVRAVTLNRRDAQPTALRIRASRAVRSRRPSGAPLASGPAR